MGDPRSAPIPIYQQVANILRAGIMDHRGEAKTLLPTERELCSIHHVSRETIRKALVVLEADGLIERTRRRGTLTIPDGIRAWRRLRHGRAIRLVTSSEANPDVPAGFYGQIHQGIFERCEALGYTVSIQRMDSTFPRNTTQYASENLNELLGVITTAIADEPFIAMHAQSGCPVICVDYLSHHPQVDCVVMDCFSEGQVAAEFLLSQGHRDFFYVGNRFGPRGRGENEVDCDLMLAGCQRALRRAGVPMGQDHIHFIQQKNSESKQVAAWFAGCRPRPTAGIVFGSPVLTYLRDNLREYGLSCPQDVSLICKAAVGESLAAATLRGDAGLMGRTAVDLLMQRASGRRSHSLVVSLRPVLQRGPSVRSVGIPGQPAHRS